MSTRVSDGRMECTVVPSAVHQLSARLAQQVNATSSTLRNFDALFEFFT